MLAYSFHHLHGLDVSSLRFFTVYGPAGRPDMSVFRFIRKIAEGEPIVAYGDGHQQLDFTYVEDIARGVVASLVPVGFEVVNLGGDRPVELLEVIRQITQALGCPARSSIARPIRQMFPPPGPTFARPNACLAGLPASRWRRGWSSTVQWCLEHRTLARSSRL